MDWFNPNLPDKCRTAMELLLNDTAKPNTVADDVVVTLKYTLTVDGEIVDSANESDPIEFLQGAGEVISGLEAGIHGLKVGESRKITIKPADGYGEIDKEAYVTIPRDEFPSEIPLEIGIEIDVRDEDDEVMTATIAEVTNTTVTLDFNHPLAGKTLHFDVTVLELRTPTAEELEHGHVHSADWEEYEFDDDDFEDDEDDEDED